MRRPALIAVGLAAAALATTQGLADNTDTSNVTVNGNVVAPLTISPNANLIMPHIVRPSTGEPTGQVVLTCDSTSDANNAVTYSNRSNPFAHGISTAANQGPQSGSANMGVGGANFTGTCAQLSVSGQANYYYITTIGAVTGVPPAGVSIVGVNCIEGGLTLTSGSSRQLSGGGSATIRCGATVQVTSASTATTYTAGQFNLTVTYD